MRERTLKGCHQFHPRLGGFTSVVSLAASTSLIYWALGKLVLSVIKFEPVPTESFSMRVAVGIEGCLNRLSLIQLSFPVAATPPPTEWSSVQSQCHSWR